ncbi:MAG: sulfotransferase [bacterium]|nr:sulfotransferase [bacterium]
MPHPILVTGSHRSGTTWVGKMIALSPKVGYISEPFNPTTLPGIRSDKFANWFTYVCEENADGFYDHLRNVINFRFDILSAMQTLGYDKGMPPAYQKEEFEILENYARFAGYYLNQSIPLLKDPIAIFSSEWLARTFDAQVLVVIRHPCAFANSLKRLNWTLSFSSLLAQPLLLRDHLTPFAEELTRFQEKPGDIIDTAALLWKCIYATVRKFQQQQPRWLFLRHEDLSLQPLEYFERIYQWLGLDFTPPIARQIIQHSSAENPAESGVGAEAHQVMLSSAETTKNWKKRLSPDEIDRIRRGVTGVVEEFYGDEDW